MIRSLLKLAVVLVLAILVYNYFFGTTEEKAQSKEIFGEVRDLGKAAWGLLKTERQKFNDGKYDEAVDKVGGLINTMKDRAERLEDSDLINKIDKLERKRKAIERQLQEDTPENYDAGEKAALKREWEELMRETEDVMKELEEK
ncbi:MAG: hypothetical protein HUU34_09085 [Saprospiraceae bacterium]|jgi:hypothetical protein|nr:hypothetical protein [Saprospiraceae bacterium]